MEYVSGGIFIREMAFEKAGSVVNGHTHNFDHTTYIVRGAVKIERLLITPAVYADEDMYIPQDTATQRAIPTAMPKPGAVPITPELVEVEKTVIKRAVDGHNWVLIKAGVTHRLTALEDNSMGHCIYSHRNPQGEIVEAYDGWTEGYV